MHLNLCVYIDVAKVVFGKCTSISTSATSNRSKNEVFKTYYFDYDLLEDWKDNEFATNNSGGLVKFVKSNHLLSVMVSLDPEVQCHLLLYFNILI